MTKSPPEPDWSAVARKIEKQLYRIAFHNHGRIIELFARSISHGELFGFLEVEEIVFGEKSGILVDPGEDALKQEFENTKRVFIPLHSVIRVDELDKKAELKPRIVHLNSDGKAADPGRVTPIYTPPGPFSGK